MIERLLIFNIPSNSNTHYMDHNIVMDMHPPYMDPIMNPNTMNDLQVYHISSNPNSLTLTFHLFLLYLRQLRWKQRKI